MVTADWVVWELLSRVEAMSQTVSQAKQVINITDNL